MRINFSFPTIILGSSLLKTKTKNKLFWKVVNPDTWIADKNTTCVVSKNNEWFWGWRSRASFAYI